MGWLFGMFAILVITVVLTGDDVDSDTSLP